MSEHILAILAERDGAEACLAAAEAAAEAVSHPHIAVLHVRVDPESTILPTEEILPRHRRQELELAAAEEGHLLQSVYTAWCATLRRPLTAEWHDVVGTEAGEISRRGRDAALGVIAALPPSPTGYPRQALHAALFDTGRPVLIVPRAWTRRPARRVLIGWSDETASRHALCEARPWLRLATAILVVSVGRDPLEVEIARQVLADDTIACETKSIPHDHAPVAQQLLAEAREFRADWLVMGAYERPQFIELLFGGVTRAILHDAHLPIFMVHG